MEGTVRRRGGDIDQEECFLPWRIQPVSYLFDL